MTIYDQAQAELKASPKKWLITGVAGFIGSNLLETLLHLGQRVAGLDNLSSGKRKNLDEVRTSVTVEQWTRFEFGEGDISNLDTCRAACKGVDFVLHHAALGSVPASISDPAGAHRSNVTGFLNMLMAARETGVRRFVYASSSAVYGDDPQLPKTEDKLGNLLSPYAATKLMNEMYADVFGRVYGFHSVGLRYFNVFGSRQDPGGSYAAVIPKWIASLLTKDPVYINGDGETTRDFCHVSDIAQANLLAATASRSDALNQVYNVALGNRTTLNELFEILKSAVRGPEASQEKPIYREFRQGDVRHSVADISKAKRLLGFAPGHTIQQGLALSMDWYRHNPT